LTTEHPIILGAYDSAGIWTQVHVLEEFDYSHIWTHWAPTPKAPPLPRPVELSQEDKDQQKANQIIRTNSSGRLDGDIIDGIRYGRADGRRQLAAECLALFDGDGMLLLEMAVDEESAGFMTTGGKLRLLHKLLKEAAKP